MYRRMNSKDLETMIMMYSEDDPIWKSIDKGGGQSCDVRGVLRQLFHDGYKIVRR